MDTIKDQLSFYSSALQLRGKRNNILASNIANAATPNYKARDISFEDEIKKFVQVGSSIEYGKIRSPQLENIKNDQKTFSVYGNAKLLSTKFLLDLKKKFDFPVVITSSIINTLEPFLILKPLLKVNLPLTLSQNIVSFFKILPIS